jgi:transcriptional regulator GlxA family with amidase domain
MAIVDVVLFDGVDELDFCAPFEILASCRRLLNGKWAGQPAFQVQTVAETRAPIRTAHGLSIIPDITFDKAPNANVVIVPGGPGAQNEHLSHRLLEFLHYSSDTSDVVASVCTGVFILARAGLTDHHSVTTHATRIPDLQKQYPKTRVVTGQRVVIDGANRNLITTGGISCGVDLALALIKRFEGRDTAAYAARRIEWPVDVPMAAVV